MKKNKVKYLFEKKLCGIIIENKLISQGQTVLAAFSGGIDSVVMLFALNSISKKIGFSLKAAHVNHGIRESAKRDEEFAKHFAASLNIPFISKSVDIPTEAKRLGKGIEETARIIRYNVLEKFLDELDADLIATAHNKNDNAETVLFNIIRGSGLNGLCGIPEKRGNLIRPLLNFSRAEIEEYASFCKLEHVEDETNADTVYTRNFLRQKIFPLITQINPNAVDNFSKLSKAAKNDIELIETVINDTDNYDLHPSVLYRKLIRDYSNLTNKTLETIHLQSIEKVLRKSLICNDTFEISLPGNISAVIKKGKVKFTKKQNIISQHYNKNYNSENTNRKFVLRPGENRYNNYRILLYESTQNFEQENINNNSTQFTLDSDKINGCIFVRSRKSGDSLICHGINRNLKKCFINKKIPREKRNFIPIFCDEQGIICVPNIGIADRVFTKNPRNALKIILQET